MKFYTKQIASIGLVALSLTGSIHASSVTIGPNGIHSDGLTLAGGTVLTGAGIGIGQVELARPGKRVADGGFDNAANSNTTINPTEVFVRTTGGAGIANMNTSEHAEQVAGVIISTDTSDPDGAGPLVAPTGVAIGAELYSSATNPIGPDFDAEAAITTQYIATRNGGDIRAINLSFQNGLVSGNLNDGNQLYTQFIDWSAKEHDVLYVAAGKNSTSPAGNSIPTDNFNGVTVGRSIKVGSTYRGVSTGNDFSQDAEGDRTSIDLIAPGDGIDVTGLANVHATQSGASFAAPHVTGTVALLQEYGDQRIGAGAVNWDTDARRHEVMKAVLMNSADKFIDDGTVTVPGGLSIPTGGLLGMERTVVKQDGTSTWFDSDSWDDSTDSGQGGFFPLDEEMGAGHLNARRALQQFAAGEHEEFGVTGAKVPVMGWDYGTTTGDNDINRYRFNQELEAGSFIAITLAWDREVEFDVDNGTIGEYDIGDTFVEYVDPGFGDPAGSVINELGLHFMPAFAGNINQEIAFSTGDGTLQHIFFQVETTGEFEFWVRQTDEDVSVNQDYAVAWWALGTGPLIAGDFDGDGDVDDTDFAQWQSDFALNSTSDADADLDSDGLDFLAWQRNFGTGVPLSAAVGTVPEPATGMLLLMGLGFAMQLRPRRKNLKTSE